MATADTYVRARIDTDTKERASACPFLRPSRKTNRSRQSIAITS